MRAWIAGLLGAAMAAGAAAARPPRELEVNVTYCTNQNIEARGSGPQQESVGRLRKDCERLVESLDSQLRHQSAYVRGSIAQRREIVSDAIDCRIRMGGRPGTSYQDCIREILDRYEPPESR
jgi:hypothetical protein